MFISLYVVVNLYGAGGNGQRNILGAEGDEAVQWFTDSGEFHSMGLVCFSGKLCSDQHCARSLKVPTTVLVY